MTMKYQMLRYDLEYYGFKRVADQDHEDDILQAACAQYKLAVYAMERRVKELADNEEDNEYREQK